jgi:hypothetical protein
MKTPINLWLDDVRQPIRPREDWIWCIDAPSAVMMVLKHNVINMSLDHDLGDGPTGYDFVKWMGETGNWPKYKPNVHSQNPVGAANSARIH